MLREELMQELLEYYLENACGFNGLEDFVAAEYPMHSAEAQAEMVDWLRERI